MPAITRALENRNITTFYYGNFNRNHTQWNTFGDAPRYGTEYVGLSGRMSLLAEALGIMLTRVCGCGILPRQLRRDAAATFG